MEQNRVDESAAVFYRTWRAGMCRLSDGGGPFGFDITVALLADDLITRYGCDAIAETGCFLGDTTAYLARRYPRLPVYTCDIDPGFCAFTARRLAACPNVTVTCEDSPAMLARVYTRHCRTFAFLDAHWGQRWPLAEELNTLADAVALIHDFDIGHAVQLRHLQRRRLRPRAAGADEQSSRPLFRPRSRCRLAAAVPANWPTRRRSGHHRRAG